MEEVTRRAALRAAAVAGIATAASVPGVAYADVPEAEGDRHGHDEYDWSEDELADLERIRTIGFHEDEALCWLLTIRATSAYFALEALHPSEMAEVAQAVHIIQSKLMARPAYREYLRLAGAYPPEN